MILVYGEGNGGIRKEKQESFNNSPYDILYTSLLWPCKYSVIQTRTYASFPSRTAMWKGVNPSSFFSSRHEVLCCTSICVLVVYGIDAIYCDTVQMTITSPI